MRIGSLASVRLPSFERWILMSMPSDYVCRAAEKNDLRRLRTTASKLLRSASSVGPRPRLRRSTSLSGILPSKGFVSELRGRETRTPRLVGRQPALYETVRLRGGTALPRDDGEGCRRGDGPGLADGQGPRQAIHGRAASASGRSSPEGDRHR